MSPAFTAFLIMISSCTSLVLTLWLRPRLPVHHEEAETRDLIKTATGMLATLVALILGLLVSSAKGTFDTASSELTQSGAHIINLNRTLVDYGPEAQPVRALLQTNLASVIERIWPEPQSKAVPFAKDDASATRAVAEAIRQLQPQDDTQKLLKTKAESQLNALADGRWLLFEQMENPLPPMLLLVLGFWLFLLFMGLGLLAPRNATSVLALLTCILSMSAAVFLILELNHPLDGLIKVSSGPLRAALVVVSR